MADNSNDTAIRSLGAQVANLAIGKAYAEQESADKDAVISELEERVRLLQHSLDRANSQVTAYANGHVEPGEVISHGETAPE